MKSKFLLFLALFCFFVASAQKYSFNTMTVYSQLLQKNSRVTVSYFNSNTNAYFLKIFKNKGNLEALLYDFHNNKIHEFSVIQTGETDNYFFDFKYVTTIKTTVFDKNSYLNSSYDFETISVNDSIKKVNLKMYKNAKKKKILVNYELEIKTYPRNVFPAFRISCMHPYEFAQKMNPFEKGVVIAAKGFNASGLKIRSELQTIEEVNFELIVQE